MSSNLAVRASLRRILLGIVGVCRRRGFDTFLFVVAGGSRLLLFAFLSFFASDKEDRLGVGVKFRFHVEQGFVNGFKEALP